MSELATKGWAKWLDEQLDPASLADGAGDQVRSLYPELAWDIPATRANIDMYSWDSMYALGQGTLALAAWSTRQLFEVTCEFWSNHLNVACPSDGAWDNRADYDRAVIRANAFGKFSDMLLASANHPAMLQYLNNADSTKRHPNENYGRELLELHTVGVDAGYTEVDVANSARIMTGWTVDDEGEAMYRSDWHATGAVKVMDFTHANTSRNGQAVVEQYVKWLARRPQTARRLATKLCIRFVSDNPPDALVGRVASIYLANDTAIVPMLREIFASDEFWAASGAKIRRPYEDVVASIRAAGHKILPASSSAADRRYGVQAYYWMVSELQQAPLAWHPPTGYPDVASAWGSADMTLGRINAHRTIVEGWWPSDTMVDFKQPASLLPSPLPKTYGDLLDAVSRRLIQTTLPSSHRTAILAFFGKTSASTLASNAEIVSWRAGTLAALILDSPVHAVR